MRLRVSVGLILITCATATCLMGQESFVVLEIGRRAIYDVESGSGLGVRRSETIMRIEGKEEINGKEYFKTVSAYSGIPGAEPDVWYQRLAADGLYELRYVKGRPVEQLSLPLPLEIGRAWSSKFGDVETTCRIEAREPAILPGKTYDDAYKVSCSGKIKKKSFKSHSYFVAGIGLVRSVRRDSNGMVFEARLREAGKIDV